MEQVRPVQSMQEVPGSMPNYEELVQDNSGCHIEGGIGYK
jgi:hypothetical protein